MDEIILKGYHITDTMNVEDIIDNGFTSKINPKHYLGQGIYFYTDFDIAKLNTNNFKIDYGFTKNKSIIECVVVIHESNFLDLDNYVQLHLFKLYWQQFQNDLNENNIQLEFFENKDYPNNKMLYLKCYVLDLYTSEKGIKVISRTFPASNTSYGINIRELDFDGLSYWEKYLCVKDTNCITQKTVVYQKNLEEVLFV